MSNLSMEARIELETRDLKPKEVKELFLDNCRASTLTGLTDKYEELEVLSMINIGLTSLKGFPAYPKLRSLEVSDNKLAGDLEYLKSCPNLTSLKICNNRIKDVATLEPLKLLSNLSSLDLIECPIAEVEKYRDKVFSAIPQLTFLDGIDREGTAEPDSDEDFELDDEGEDDDLDSEEEEDEEEEDDEDDDKDGEDGEEQNVSDNEEAVVEVPDDESQPAAKRAKIDPDIKNVSDDVEL